jgi:ketopantoate reductase
MRDRIAVIGAGVIGGAIVNSLLKSGYDGEIVAADMQPEKLSVIEKQGINVTSDNKKAAREADVVFLCVKPNIVAPVLKLRLLLASVNGLCLKPDLSGLCRTLRFWCRNPSLPTVATMT